jgi:benzoate-CoA ligase family protein
VLELDSRAPGRVFNMVTPLLDRHVAEGRGDRVALRLLDGELTYSELQALANRAGNALRAAGVEPEQRVAILLHDGPEFVATFLGAMKMGAVPVPLNTLAPPADLAYYLSDSRARALVADAGLVGAALGAPDLPLLRRILVVGQPPEHPLAASFADALAAASPDLAAFPTGVDEPCYWLYSSGTTGRSKGVVHLHGDMLPVLTPYAQEVVRIDPEDSTFSVAKLFFSYGLGNSLFLPLLAGASVVLTPRRPEPKHVLEIVERFRPTLFFSVPTSYGQLCAALEGRTNTPFGSVRLGVSAGEPLPPTLYRRWTDLTGIEVLDGLGSTEVGYIYCSNLPGQVRAGSSGVPIGDHQLRLVDEEGRETSDGELWVRAESTALHYWNQRTRTKETFQGEWLRTNDRYVRDEDGFYWYQGRMNDVFKVSGQWVSPMEVEDCLLTHPAVLEAAVVGAADPEGLLKPKAYVVLRPGVDAEPSDLQNLTKSRLQPHKYPRWVVFLDELPKTASGKIQRYRLRELG